MIMTKQEKTRPSALAVTPDESGVRLDRWFKRHYPALGHSVLQKLLRTGQIRLDGKRAEASDRLQAGQCFRLPPQILCGDFEASAQTAEGAKPMRRGDRLRDYVLYEDDDVVALNKPAGLAVQGGTGLKENLDDTLMVLSLDGVTKPKLVHRLDRETSGVLLIARNDFAASKLTEAFRDRATRKIYWALTQGVPKPKEGRIEAALVKTGAIMRIAKDESARGAKDAVTLYKVLDKTPQKVAFVALWPLTGRTHQLRVHLASLGTPIHGDKLYGGAVHSVVPTGEGGSGLHLHARRLVVPHPRKGIIDVTAPLSAALRKTWAFLKLDENAKEDFTNHPL